ncbi:hypothetical protein GCM10010407_04930 [Rarobacter incanus]
MEPVAVLDLEPVVVDVDAADFFVDFLVDEVDDFAAAPEDEDVFFDPLADDLVPDDDEEPAEPDDPVEDDPLPDPLEPADPLPEEVKV